MIDSREPFRIVMVGCGGIADNWLKPLSQWNDCRIVALVDLNRESAERKKAKFNLTEAAVFPTLAEALAVTPAEAVFNLTPPAAHRDVALEAFAHGCHVLGEKPMANNLKEAREMIRAADRAGKQCAVIQNRRYMDGIVRFTRFLRSGAIGALTTLNADFYLGAHCRGFQNEMEHPLLLDMAIHSFDAARFISGQDPVSVYCLEWNPPGSWFRHGAAAMAIFEMSGGAIFNYRGSWCAEGVNTSWECEWRAVGSAGSAVWDGNTRMKAERPLPGEGAILPQTEIAIATPPPLEYTRHAGVIREFLDCVKTGREPQTAGRENIKSLAMVYAAIQSATTGQKVKIEW